MSATDFGRYGTQGNGPAAAYDPAMRSGHEIAVVRPPSSQPRFRSEVQGHQYFIYRLPNWRLTRWAIGRFNRYLRESGSSWKLGIKYRDPIKGHKYGYAGALKQAHAKSVSLYLRQRRVLRMITDGGR